MNVLLVGYRIDDLEAAVKFFDGGFFQVTFNERILVLNNPELEPKVKHLAPRWKVIIGSNTFGEFSGWQEGLAHLTDKQDRVLFANDTITTHRNFTWLRKTAFYLASKASGAAVVGFSDSLGKELTVGDYHFDRWISTYCFMLTPDALGRLKFSLLDIPLVRQCVHGGLDEQSFFDCMSPSLAEHLKTWLFAGWWYGGGALTALNADRLKRKAEAIVSEKILSARCQTLGVHLVDPFKKYPVLHHLDRLLRAARRAVEFAIGSRTDRVAT